MNIKFRLDQHLGDQVIALNTLYLISKYNDLFFDIYDCSPQIIELGKYCDNLRLFPQSYTGDMVVYSTWCGNYGYNPMNTLKTIGFEATVIEYFKFLFKSIIGVDIDIPFNSLCVSLPSIVYNEQLQHIKEFDYLIINSDGLSGQCDNNYKDKVLNNYISQLCDAGLECWVTKKVDRLSDKVLCTQDFYFSLRDIAELSLKCDHIVSVATGPLVGCFNSKNIFKDIVVIDNNSLHIWDGVNTKNIVFEDLYK